MPNVPPSLSTYLGREEAELARLYIIVRRDGKTYSLTDWQLPIVANILDAPTPYLANDSFRFVPLQSPNSSAIVSELGLSPANATFGSYLRIDGIDIQDIRLGLFQSASVSTYICNPDLPNSACLLVRGYLAEAKELGGELFEISFKAIEEKLNKNIGATVSERCHLKLGDKRCTIPAITATATITAIESRSQYVMTVNSLLDTAPNFWQFGSLFYATTGVASPYDISVDIIESEYLGMQSSRIKLLNRTEKALLVGGSVTLLEGCENTVRDCNSRGNIVNYRGYPDLPGIDKLITSA